MKPYSVLFICTDNAIRSPMAEAMMNHFAADRFMAYSAGRQALAELHPLTLATLQHFGVTPPSPPKSWNTFLLAGAPEMDFIFTLDDATTNEVCPSWPGGALTAHWNVEDPSLRYQEMDRRKAFHDVFLFIKHRIDLLAALPMDKLAHLASQHHVQQIGQTVPPAPR
ncbi:arsenate reductase ArsC [uncultured Deefgea sp.]|uniref:arsenate reductase ArsC n=1 Tax=uncultured Deefgea sp. TaxID=1304914 RepID=UPI002591AE38|nr:arsenate reductase ArsC [uncultured Deefgea sp.]